MAKLYVVAKDNGYEGHAVPYLAFQDIETAAKWVRTQDGAWSIAEVPTFPELPDRPWFQTYGVTPPE